MTEQNGVRRSSYACDTCAHCGGTMRDSTTFVRCHARDRTRETYLPVQRLSAEAGREREVCERWTHVGA